MLRHRIITAAILIPIVVAAVYFLEHVWFAAFLGLITVLAAWEWAGIAGINNFTNKILYSGLMSLLLVISFVYSQSLLIAGIFISALLWWSVSVVIIISYQHGRRIPGLDQLRLKTVIGFLVLMPAWFSLVRLHGSGDTGVMLVFFLLILIWVADTAAYFTGRRWGRNKLASRVSPGKSWEGVAGAVLAGIVLGIVFSRATGMQQADILIFLGVCVVTVAASILGDLMESLMKRQAEMKDSGSLLPGHGGILDRIDSLAAAAPVFVAGLWLSQII